MYRMICLVSVLNVVPKKPEKQVCNVYTSNLFYFMRYTLKGYQQLLFKVFKKIYDMESSFFISKFFVWPRIETSKIKIFRFIKLMYKAL